MTETTETERPFFNRNSRYFGFAAATAAIWLACFLWRPPGPVLGLRHVERWRNGEQKIALTFDDAPHPLTTPLLLASLKRTGVKASFFVVGDGLRFYPEIAERIVLDGHRLANHSQYHINLTRVSPAEYGHEILTCFKFIDQTYANAGVRHQPTRLFRPPGGGMNRQVMKFLYDNDVTLAWWSNNVGDWARPPAWKIASEVKANLRAGDIVLLHDAGIGTPQALPNIIKDARGKGLQIEPMPESH